MAVNITQEQLPEGGTACTYSKECNRKCQNSNISGFLQQTFLGSKTQKWRPILDLSSLNKYLKSETFKMETPEDIGTSLQQGKWVTSIDFKDASFHIPINPQSRKYLHFHIQGQSCQIKALTILVCPLLQWNSQR